MRSRSPRSRFLAALAPTTERVGIAFAAGGFYALLPTGPGAPAAATVTAAGTGAAPLAAVIVYTLLVTAANLNGVRPRLRVGTAQSQMWRARR